jgi:hypothetical protein
MSAHNGIVACFADEAGLLAVVSSQMVVVDDTRGQVKSLPQAWPMQNAPEINPLAAVTRPHLPPTGFRYASAFQRFLEWP